MLALFPLSYPGLLFNFLNTGFYLVKCSFLCVLEMRTSLACHFTPVFWGTDVLKFIDFLFCTFFKKSSFHGTRIFCSTGFIIFNNLNYSNVPLLKIMCILKYLLNILKIFFKWLLACSVKREACWNFEHSSFVGNSLLSPGL